MKTRELLRTTQPTATQTLLNSFRDGKTSHAYLISGPKGTPLKETALFLAQSFLCDNPDPLADEECATCRRVASGSYADFKFYDGSKGEIKKEGVLNLQASYSISAVEPKGIKIYVIHLIEYANASVLNSLLKFIEEPDPGVVAIFTTENLSQVLPTLVSRCQVLRLKSFEKEDLIRRLQEKGVGEEDAFILAENYSSLQEATDFYENAGYLELKDLAVDTLRTLVEDFERINFFAMQEVIPIVAGRGKTKVNAQLYFDLLGTILKDVLKLKTGRKPIFRDQERLIIKASEINFPVDKFITRVMFDAGKLNKVVNVGLVIDDVFVYMREEGAKSYAEYQSRK